MRSSKHAKHVKPALHPTRSTLSAGLTAVLLPLCLASPALANSAPAASATSATSTATASGASPSASPGQDRAKQQTVLRISGPRGAVSPGRHAVAVRLLADDRPVKDGYVRLEKWTSSGWAYAGRLLTRADGLGSGKLSMTRTTKLRAVYQGSITRTAAASAPMTVTVGSSLRAGSTQGGGFRQQAVRSAAAQNGKPYRYGSTGPDSFDCSGLIQYAFRQAGKSLPRTSGDMYRVSQKISQSAKQPGDLIFMSTDGRIGHVGVYAGNGKFWDAPRAGKNVSLRPIYSASYYVGRVN
ncbi:MAG: C40 family peptidase [Frankiales bacterium]|nr:C40 family peptidase [Frankiales bacterium]